MSTIIGEVIVADMLCFLYSPLVVANIEFHPHSEDYSLLPCVLVLASPHAKSEVCLRVSKIAEVDNHPLVLSDV